MVARKHPPSEAGRLHAGERLWPARLRPGDAAGCQPRPRGRRRLGWRPCGWGPGARARCRRWPWGRGPRVGACRVWLSSCWRGWPPRSRARHVLEPPHHRAARGPSRGLCPRRPPARLGGPVRWNRSAHAAAPPRAPAGHGPCARRSAGAHPWSRHGSCVAGAAGLPGDHRVAGGWRLRQGACWGCQRRRGTGGGPPRCVTVCWGGRGRGGGPRRQEA